MNGNELFGQLVQRLQSYPDAAVLWILLKEEADVREEHTTASKMANEQLCETVSRAAVQRAFKRLAGQGFLSIRSQKNTKTLITVHREAVLELLRQPMPQRLPALSQKRFPFLEAWAEDRSAAEAEARAADAGASDSADDTNLPQANPAPAGN